MDYSILLYTCILSFSGFVFAFYGILAENKIEKIVEYGSKRGISLETNSGVEYFANKMKKWGAGSFFVSKQSFYFGITITFLSAIICFIYNPWWYLFIVLSISYFLYLFLANILGSFIQLLAMISLLLSIIMIVYSLFN